MSAIPSKETMQTGVRDTTMVGETGVTKKKKKKKLHHLKSLFFNSIGRRSNKKTEMASSNI